MKNPNKYVKLDGLEKLQEKLRMNLKNYISAMNTIVSRLDVTQIFCKIDDLGEEFEQC